MPRIEMRVSAEWLARLDEYRGDMPRGTFIKRLVDDGLATVVVTGEEQEVIEVQPRSAHPVDVGIARAREVREAVKAHKLPAPVVKASALSCPECGSLGGMHQKGCKRAR
jgi:hypothetical protein